MSRTGKESGKTGIREAGLDGDRGRRGKPGGKKRKGTRKKGISEIGIRAILCTGQWTCRGRMPTNFIGRMRKGKCVEPRFSFVPPVGKMLDGYGVVKDNATR
jgi:hypothetical protein